MNLHGNIRIHFIDSFLTFTLNRIARPFFVCQFRSACYALTRRCCTTRMFFFALSRMVLSLVLLPSTMLFHINDTKPIWIHNGLFPLIYLLHRVHNKSSDEVGRVRFYPLIEKLCGRKTPQLWRPFCSQSILKSGVKIPQFIFFSITIMFVELVILVFKLMDINHLCLRSLSLWVVLCGFKHINSTFWTIFCWIKSANPLECWA